MENNKNYNNYNMKEQMLLLKKIQACDFALVELGLYLDTHPTDREALSYFTKFQAMKKPLHAEYIKKYGPIKMEDFDGGNSWDWIEEPWPWENAHTLERGV